MTTREELEALMNAPHSTVLKAKGAKGYKGGKKAKGSAQPKGHFLPPGTGPAGETCGTCRHMARREYSRIYLKCELNRKNWTGGTGTDVRSRDPACKAWEPKTPKPGEEK